MKKLISGLLLGLTLFSANVYAQTLSSHTFENQWEKPVELNSSTQWVLLSQSKDPGNYVKEAFEALKVEDPAKYNMIYIADISAMPSFVTKLFALPKMRDYAFPIALVREEGQLANLKLDSYDKEKAALLKLTNLEVSEVLEFDNTDTLTAKLKEIIK